MMLPIFSPGRDTVAGEYAARFLVSPGSSIPTISQDQAATIADTPIVIHPSRYDFTTGILTIPFTIESGTLDGTSIGIGLLTLLGVTVATLKLISVDKEMNIDALFLVVVLFIIYLLKKG